MTFLITSRCFICWLIGIYLLSCTSPQSKKADSVSTLAKEEITLPLARDSTLLLRYMEDSLSFLSRQAWGAAPPIKEMKSHIVHKITVHHSAVKISELVNPIEKMRSLQEFSQQSSTLANGRKKPAWADIPYHFVIYPQGDVAIGRKIDYVGDTNTEYDPSGHILINVAGNFEEQEPTLKQLAKLEQLCFYLSLKYHISSKQIKGHRDFAKTLCPGKNLQEKLEIVREKVSRRLENWQMETL